MNEETLELDKIVVEKLRKVVKEILKKLEKL